MTLTDSQDRRLAAAVDAAIDLLREIPDRLSPLGDTHYAIHDQYAERAASLSRYLRTAIAAIRNKSNSPGYALLRCALEHYLIDLLFMRADRYVTTGPLSQDTYERLYEQWRRGDEATRDVIEMWRNEGGHVRIVRQGPHVTDDEGRVLYGLSIYFAYLDKFDPLLGPPEEQRYLEASWTDLSVLENQAREQQRIYGQAFKWNSIRENLQLNDLYVDEDTIRLNVHYRFLSGFVHLTPRADAILQQQATSVVPVMERERPHPAWELGHLYAGALAARELEAFLRMADSQPEVGLDGRSQLEDAAAEARTISRHLWFPGDPPHPYDVFRKGAWETWRRDTDATAEDVGVVEPYHRNPFERLKELHRPQAMGGEVYRPDFFISEGRCDSDHRSHETGI